MKKWTLKEVEGKTCHELDVNFPEIHEQLEVNLCDMCLKFYHINRLIWITAEDFIPRKGEEIETMTYYKYDALCETCYPKILKSGKWTQKS